MIDTILHFQINVYQVNVVTTRVHCKKEKFDVYCGRPGPFGNPFKIGIHGNRMETIKKYREWVENQDDYIMRLRQVCKGRVLGCWCNRNEACHCDIIIEICDNGEADAFLAEID